MIKHIFDKSGRVLLRTEEAEPECGEDFCDHCGDCLACYGGGRATTVWVTGSRTISGLSTPM